MNVLAGLPSAFWTEAPWWTVALVVLLVGLASSPFAVAWMRGRVAAGSVRERALLAREDALDRLRDSDVDRMRAELAELRTRVRDLERDRDRGWDFARAWKLRADKVRHDFANYFMRATRMQEDWGYPELPSLEDILRTDPVTYIAARPQDYPRNEEPPAVIEHDTNPEPPP